MRKRINFNYNSWNIRNKDHIREQTYIITTKGKKDILLALKQVKDLCISESLIITGDNMYFFVGAGYGINPLDNEGDNIDNLLRIAKSLGYITKYKKDNPDYYIDYDEEL